MGAGLANEQRKRLQRMAAALAGKDLDPSGAMQAIPALRDVALLDQHVEGQPEIGRQLVNLRRWTDRTTPMKTSLFGPIRTHRGPISGPLPDPAWDRLFGALQVAEVQSASQGKRFGLNYGDFGTETTHDYSLPDDGPVRRRLMDPEQIQAARTVGAAQERARRRG